MVLGNFEFAFLASNKKDTKTAGNYYYTIYGETTETSNWVHLI